MVHSLQETRSLLLFSEPLIVLVACANEGVCHQVKVLADIFAQLLSVLLLFLSPQLPKLFLQFLHLLHMFDMPVAFVQTLLNLLRKMPVDHGLHPDRLYCLSGFGGKGQRLRLSIEVLLGRRRLHVELLLGNFVGTEVCHRSFLENTCCFVSLNFKNAHRSGVDSHAPGRNSGEV